MPGPAIHIGYRDVKRFGNLKAPAWGVLHVKQNKIFLPTAFDCSLFLAKYCQHIAAFCVFPRVILDIFKDYGEVHGIQLYTKSLPYFQGCRTR